MLECPVCQSYLFPDQRDSKFFLKALITTLLQYKAMLYYNITQQKLT